MVTVRYKGRLGNHLFQYALGRIMATELGYELEASPIKGFPGTSQPVSGARMDGDPIVLVGQSIDFQGLIRGTHMSPIVLDGYFQRYEYYRDYRTSVRDWLRPSEETRSRVLSRLRPGDVVVHVRVGDVRKRCKPNAHRVTPFAFYRSVLKRLTWDRLFLVTGDPDDALPQRLARRFGGTIVSGTREEDFEMMRAAGRLVMSASTMTWWAAWLSDAREIYFPTTGQWNPWVQRMFPSVRDVDLVVDEPRYRYPFAHRNWIEAHYGYSCRLYHALRRRGLLFVH